MQNREAATGVPGGTTRPVGRAVEEAESVTDPRTPLPYAPAEPGTNRRYYLTLVVSLLLVVLSACCAAYSVFLCVSARDRHSGENFAEFGLVVVSIPALVLQTLVFLPAVHFCAKRIDARTTRRTIGRTLRWLAALSAAVTAAAIAIGLHNMTTGTR